MLLLLARNDDLLSSLMACLRASYAKHSYLVYASLPSISPATSGHLLTVQMLKGGYQLRTFPVLTGSLCCSNVPLKYTSSVSFLPWPESNLKVLIQYHSDLPAQGHFWTGGVCWFLRFFHQGREVRRCGLMFFVARCSLNVRYETFSGNVICL